MVDSTIHNIRFAGFQAAVPTHIRTLTDGFAGIDAEEALKVMESVGVREQRVLADHQCASDMCLRATDELLLDLDWDPSSIDVLIFVSQDQDYALPATAALMQHRLGLPTGAACFDVSLGCSGFVYGCWLASTLMSSSSARRALVLCGDTSTRHLVPGDTATLPLFGDAGGAAALEKQDGVSPMFFSVGTDGKGGAHISVKAGGRRDTLVPPEKPVSEEEYARQFRDSRLHLNGSEVFAFSLRAVPKLLKNTMAYAEIDSAEVDQFVLHQANKFMLEHLRKKLKVDDEKFVIDLEKYGNTSSASIPLAISSSLAQTLSERPQKMALCGFGVGWSWGAMIADVGPIVAPKVVEIDDDYPPLQLGR